MAKCRELEKSLPQITTEEMEEGGGAGRVLS